MKKIATVDENGKVKALGVGKVTITAETENGAFKSSVELNISGYKVNTGMIIIKIVKIIMKKLEKMLMLNM